MISLNQYGLGTSGALETFQSQTDDCLQRNVSFASGHLRQCKNPLERNPPEDRGSLLGHHHNYKFVNYAIK